MAPGVLLPPAQFSSRSSAAPRPLDVGVARVISGPASCPVIFRSAADGVLARVALDVIPSVARPDASEALAALGTINTENIDSINKAKRTAPLLDVDG